MSAAEMMGRIARVVPSHGTQFVGAYYLLTVLTGAFVLLFHGRLAFAADLIASVFYIAMTALFYDLSKTVNRRKGRADPVAPCEGRERYNELQRGSRTMSEEISSASRGRKKYEHICID